MSLQKFVGGLKVRVKLLIAFGSILILSVLLIIFSIQSINRIIAFKNLNENLDQLKLHLETMELAVKEFIYEDYRTDQFLESKRSVASEKFQESFLAISTILSDFEQSSYLSAEETHAFSQTIHQLLDSVNSSYSSLVELLHTRGFKDYGLEGTLRKAIHNVENSELLTDRASMLTLRRNEKDFFLRKDLRYKEEFNNNVSQFRDQLSLDANAGELILHLDNYQKRFNEVVDIENRIGLNETDGIRGSIRAAFGAMRPTLENFRSSIRTENENQINGTRWLLFVIFGFQLVAGVLMTIVYANLLTKAIKEIKFAMQKLAEGKFPEKLQIRSSEEIGDTKKALNQFLDRIKAASAFAENLGNGDLNANYNERFTDDVLAKSLISMQEKLRSAEETQSKINWVNSGAAQFNEVLKNESEKLEILGDNILKLLITYLNANQGALYSTIDADEDKMERISTYAYGKKKFQSDVIEKGKGLIGQAMVEKSTIYLKEIPKDFVRITSGLGEATPRNVLIVPLKLREQVMGVIELASFQPFPQYQIEFVEKIAENIASILANKKSNAQTKRLLQDAEQRANVLTQQEEEMRQNAEELQATQEEMERQRRDLLAEIENLKARLKKHERQTTATVEGASTLRDQ